MNLNDNFHSFTKLISVTSKKLKQFNHLRLNIKHTMVICIILFVSVIVLRDANDTTSRNFVTVRATEILGFEGEPLLLRGIGIGNWLVPEGYMFGFDVATAPWQISQVLKELVGTEAVNSFWYEWRNAFVSYDDIKNIKKLGFNLIRVPFDYRDFSPEEYPEISVNRGFENIDRIIEWSAQEGLFVLIDMHAAPCGQTGSNADNTYSRPFLFQDADCIERTRSIWKIIANHYARITNVIGYELLNEPLPYRPEEINFDDKLEPFYKLVVSSIRSVDTNHIIFLSGSNWGSDYKSFRNFGFDNKLVYTFHKYWSDPSNEGIQAFVDFRSQHNVPIFMGEAGENSVEWVQTYRVNLESNSIGWAFWPYKKMIASNCVRSYLQPDLWEEIVVYQKLFFSHQNERRKAQPSFAHASRAMSSLLKNVKYINTNLNEKFILALGLNP